MSPEARERHEKHVADVKERSKTKKPYHEINIFDLVTHIDGKPIKKKITTVTSENKAEHDKNFMNARAGKSEEKKPHEMPHEIIHKETGKVHGPYESLEHAYNEYQNFSPQNDYAIGRTADKKQ